MEESMKKKLKGIKALFADVDNTLFCVKIYSEDSKRVVGFKNYEDWLRFNIFNNAYINCTAPRGVMNLVKEAHEMGIKIYGLTECTNSFEYNSKFNRLKECYPDGVFEHHGELISIDDRHKKVLIMQMIAERDGLRADEIMFIDDSYSEIMEAFDAGMFAMHTTEVMERFT